jgi:phenylacetate-CoA ligase
MRDALKRIPLVEDLIRRNPFYYARFRQLLDAVEAMDGTERRALMARLTGRAIGWATQLPGYRGFAAGKALGDFPILTKEQLQASSHDYFRESIAGVSASTGGSSGRPLQLVRSARSVVMEQATIDWLAAKANVDLVRCRVAVLRGDIIKDPNDQRGPFWRQDGARRLVLSSNHLKPANFASFAGEIERFRPDVLLAYPSSLQLLASLAEDWSRRLRFVLVITSSETLRPGLRQRTRSVFGAELLDHYGMAERVAAAWSLEDGIYRFILPYGAAELLAQGEGKYRILGTTLWNSAQPLIRYDTGDIAMLPGSNPDLERVVLGVDPFMGIEGRASDVLELADGARVYALGQVTSGVRGVATVQFVQQALDLVQVIVVPGAQYDPESLEAIKRNFYLKAPESVRIAFELRDAPFRLPNGKAPVFVNNMAHT